VAREPSLTLMHHGHEVHAAWYCTTCGEPIRDRDLQRRVNDDGWDLAGPVLPTEEGRSR
jgi:hypothetical protein